MKRAVESDHPVIETARDLGVNVNTLHTWIGKYHRPRASGKAGKNDEHNTMSSKVYVERSQD